ncbi:unnamed protein product [Effrenium voratum]|nr:unnamed protein product [Effrenium voratum]
MSQWLLQLPSKWRRALKGLTPDPAQQVLARQRQLGRTNWRRALAVFARARAQQLQLSDLHYAAAMRACQRGGEPTAAMRLFAEIEEPSTRTLTAAIASCGPRDWELAVALLGAMEFPDLAAYSACLKVLKAKPSRALRLLDTLRRQQLSPDLVCYSAVISACGQGRFWLKALACLRHLDQDAVAPNVVAYSAAISACEKALQWEQGLFLLREMAERGIKPNVVSHSAVLTACDKARQWQWTLHHWKEMRAAGVAPNRVSYTAAIGSTAWDAMLEMLEEMWCKEVTPDLQNYTAALGCLEKAKQWEQALLLLTDMRRKQLTPDLICRSIVKRARFAGRLGRRSGRRGLPDLRARRLAASLERKSGVEARKDWGYLSVPETFFGAEVENAQIYSKLNAGLNSRERFAAGRMAQGISMELPQQEKDEEVLPADIKKEEVKKVNFIRRQPKKGDEVEIHYHVSASGVLLDTSLNGDPIRFNLGTGMVMEAWDRVVATMRKGEISKFTVPEMYRTGGPQQFLAKLPDDGEEVVYEIELVQVVGIVDLFGDGNVIERIHDDGEEYGFSPKDGDELLIDYELSLKSSGQVLDKREGMDFRMLKHLDNGVLCSKAIQKSLVNYKLNSCGTLVVRADYACGDAGDEKLGIPPKADVAIKLKLLQIYEFEDAGKKAFWEPDLVQKKAIKPERCRLCPGFDGTWCKVKILGAKLGEEELLEEQIIETTVGQGELCDALEAACAAMRKGEISLVTVKDPTLHAPGKPNLQVPPDAGHVVYKLEMLDFGSPQPEEGPSENLLLLNFAKKVKEKGSEHFKNGRYRLAHERYSRVIQLLPVYRKPPGSTSNQEVFTEWVEKKTAEELRRSSRLNLAACALKLGLHYAAARYCDEVLKEEPKNIKALYRRAQGHMGSYDFQDAAKDCKKIMELEPENKDARLLLVKVKQAEKEAAKMQREEFGASLLRKLA